VRRVDPGSKRNRATTLFAALDILDGTTVGRRTAKHRHQDFTCFLNGVDHVGPAVFESSPNSARRPNEFARSDVVELFMTNSFIEA
jgi:hypothetical protein